MTGETYTKILVYIGLTIVVIVLGASVKVLLYPVPGTIPDYVAVDSSSESSVLQSTASWFSSSSSSPSSDNYSYPTTVLTDGTPPLILSAKPKSSSLSSSSSSYFMQPIWLNTGRRPRSSSSSVSASSASSSSSLYGRDALIQKYCQGINGNLKLLTGSMISQREMAQKLKFCAGFLNPSSSSSSLPTSAFYQRTRRETLDCHNSTMPCTGTGSSSSL